MPLYATFGALQKLTLEDSEFSLAQAARVLDGMRFHAASLRSLSFAGSIVRGLSTSDTAQPATGPQAHEAVSSYQYFHIAPNGQREPFSADDNALIFAAQNRGDSAVRISDVSLPNGRLLKFEVRFAAPWGKLRSPPESGMCQVNLDNQNTRAVERDESAPAAIATSGPKPPANALAAFMESLSTLLATSQMLTVLDLSDCDLMLDAFPSTTKAPLQGASDL